MRTVHHLWERTFRTSPPTSRTANGGVWQHFASTTLLRFATCFLLFFTLCTMLRAEDIAVFNSRDQGGNRPVSTLTQGPVTVTFESCTTRRLPPYRFQLAYGTSFVVRIASGYRIRKVELLDTRGGTSGSDGIEYRVSRYMISPNDPNVEQHYRKEYPGNEAITFTYYDATAEEMRITGPTDSRLNKLEIASIRVTFVRANTISFEQSEYTAYALDNAFRPTFTGSMSGAPLCSSDYPAIATYEQEQVSPLRAGSTTLTATFPADYAYAKGECSTRVNVVRNPLTATWSAGTQPSHTLIRYKEGEGQTLYDFGAKVTPTGGTWRTGSDYSNGFVSSAPALLVPMTYSGDSQQFRATGQVGTATLTLDQAGNDAYTAFHLTRIYTVMRSDAEGTLLIRDLNEYRLFASLVNEQGMTDLNARLEANLNLGSELCMVGTAEHPYAGTFDGAGHSLSLMWSVDQSVIAPFRYVKGATLRRLHASGGIYSTAADGYFAGLVGEATGKVQLSDCASMVNLTSTGAQPYGAGLIARFRGGSATLTDCVVGANFSGEGSATRYWYGFLYAHSTNVTLTRCLYKGTHNVNSTGNFTFAPSGGWLSLTHCYYLNPCGETDARATRVTPEQLANGEVSHLLQDGRPDLHWGQTLGSETQPLLTTVADKKVYRVAYTYGEQTLATLFANGGQTITPPTLTPQSLLGEAYHPHHYYTVTLSDGFDATIPITADHQVVVTVPEQDAFPIATKDDWRRFREVVESGQNQVDAVLMADIDLGSDLWMVGTWERPYGGTFEGNDHSITLGWLSRELNLAPFRYIRDATFRRLHTKGSIDVSVKLASLSGLVFHARGNVTLTGCSSRVDFNLDVSTLMGSGLISNLYPDARATLTDCFVGGACTVLSDKFYGGEWMNFVRTQNDSHATLTRCLSALTFTVPLGSEGTPKISDYPFGRFARTTLTDCYYYSQTAKEDARATQVTEAQLRSGEMAHRLQAGRPDAAWGQVLGSEATPLPTAAADKQVHRVAFTYGEQVLDILYANHGQPVTPPALDPRQLLGEAYNVHHYYQLAFANGFGAETPVMADQQVEALITEDEGFPIATKDDWKQFCDLVSAGQTTLDAVLKADIDLGSDIWMVGTSAAPYRGTFDGHNYRLTMAWDGGDQFCAPFRCIEGATLRRLHTRGHISTTDAFGYVAGMVAEARGAVTLTGCSSLMDLKVTGRSGKIAGLITALYSPASATLSDCLVGGELRGSEEAGQEEWAGFVGGDPSASVSLTRCLYVGTHNATTGSTFCSSSNGSLTACYYLRPFYSIQGTEVAEAQLRSGELAHRLQAGRPEAVWGQVLGSDAYPRLTAAAHEQVYRVDFQGVGVGLSRLVNSGQTVTPPTLQELIGSETEGLSLQLPEGFDATLPITSNQQVALRLSYDKERFTIASPEDWALFCRLVSYGFTTLDAVLTRDIDLGSTVSMLGTATCPYAGTLDGGDHRLNLTWDATLEGAPHEPDYALLRYVQGATLRQLHTEGTLRTADPHALLSGMVGHAAGHVTLTGCSSRIQFTLTGTQGQPHAAGLIGELAATASATLSDCLVGGAFTYDNAQGAQDVWQGLVYTLGGQVQLSHCLSVTQHSATQGRHNFVNGDTPSLTHCYYDERYGNPAQGEAVSQTDLQNGALAYRLQDGRSETAWGQYLGNEPFPQPTTFPFKQVYRVTFTYEGQPFAQRYAYCGSTVSLPKVSELRPTDYADYSFVLPADFDPEKGIEADRSIALAIKPKEWMEIGSKEDWIAFCERIESGADPEVNARLTADIDLGTDLHIAASDLHYYHGTFDGQGHSITVDWSQEFMSDMSLFGHVGDATFLNLHTKGRIQSRTGNVAGLIQYVEGEATLRQCSSDMTLISGAEDTHQAAGLVWIVLPSGQLSLSDCLVKSRFHDTEGDEGRLEVGGVVGRSLGSCTLQRVLFCGSSEGAQTTRPFYLEAAEDIPLHEAYYLHGYDAPVQGQPVSQADLQNGALAYRLQDGREQPVWGQTLGNDATPLLTSAPAQHVYQVAFVNDPEGSNQVIATRYANHGQCVALPPPALLNNQSTLAPTHYYALSPADDFTATTPIVADRRVPVTVTEHASFPLASKEDWKALCELVSSGWNQVAVTMTADIDLGADVYMVGTQQYQYSGRFEGNDHTLTLNWEGGNSIYAPFLWLDRAVISRLHMRGRISSSNHGGGVAGLAWYVSNRATIANCTSMMDLSLSGSGGYGAGLMGRHASRDKAAIVDCLVGGTFRNATEGARNTWSGFAHCTEGAPLLANCLYVGSSNATEGSATFYTTYEAQAILSRCYYLHPCGTPQGTPVTEEQLRDGSVAQALQVGIKSPTWGQTLGGTPAPYREALKGTPNYLYWDPESRTWHCASYTLTGHLPAGVTFTAAEATLHRPLKAGQLCTVTVPFAWRMAGKAYLPSHVSKDGKVAHFQEVKLAEGETYEAYAPYLFRPENDAEAIRSTDVQVTKEPDLPLRREGKDGVMLIPAYGSLSNEEAAYANAYILQNDGLWHSVTEEYATAYIPAYRAYLTLDNVQYPTQSLSFVLDDDVVSSLRAIETTDTDGTVRYYDLNGRYIGNTLDGQPKGVYIANGKKVMNP